MRLKWSDMNTRQITEYQVFVLCLADMHGGVDKAKPLAVFDDLEKLKNYYKDQLADAPYSDVASMDNYGNTHSWSKVFKKGSRLEWFNPANSLEVTDWQSVAFGGVTEQWVTDVRPESFNVPFNP